MRNTNGLKRGQKLTFDDLQGRTYTCVFFKRMRKSDSVCEVLFVVDTPAPPHLGSGFHRVHYCQLEVLP